MHIYKCQSVTLFIEMFKDLNFTIMLIFGIYFRRFSLFSAAIHYHGVDMRRALLRFFSFLCSSDNQILAPYYTTRVPSIAGILIQGRDFTLFDLYCEVKKILEVEIFISL